MNRRCARLAFIGLVVGLVSGPPSLADQTPNVLGTIADNDSVYIDGTTFTITPGKGKGDVSGQVKALDARELGPGAIIFRSGQKLFIIDAPLLLRRNGPAGPESLYVNAEQARSNRIRIEYAPPKNPEHQMLYDMIREQRALETLQQIFSPFRLPVDLTIKTMGCDGMINSWFNTDNSVPTVHMCYELLQDILQTAPKDTTAAGIEPRDAVVGQFMFWVSHEMGHAMFDIFQTPVFGSEELAADQFAAYIMLQFGRDRARRLIGGAVYAANTFMQNYKQNPEVEKRLEKYASVHGLPEQRFYNLLCLAYGADPKTFADVAGVLPKRRADNCDYEYQSFSRAWRSEMSPHIDARLARTVLDATWLPRPPAPLAR